MDDNTLSEVLLQKGLLTEKQLAKARELLETLGSSGRLGEIVVRLGYVTETQLKQLAKEKKQLSVDISTAKVDIEAIESISEDFLKEHVILPLKHDKPGKILLAMTSTTDMETVESVQFMTNSLVETMVADKDRILQRLDDLFSVSRSKRMKIIDVVRGEEAVLDEPPQVLCRAVAELLIEKGVISKSEIFSRTRKIKE